ncbi:MAG: putative membrane protein [Sediminicola sp.]|jgi:uncharacterized membrane protein|tara:strand:+ start:9087 stop:10775 length:1689 start_codon:yes stop_codon:yes gene_type:complete
MTKIYYKKQRNFSLKNSNLVIIALSLLMSFTTANAQFFELGSGFTATSASSDGSVVVGDNGGQNFMWIEGSGVVLIGGVAPQNFGGRTDVSGDGTFISATRINPNTNLGELSSYNVATQTWTSHGSLGSSSGSSASSAWGMSSDGNTVVGLGWVNAGSAHAIKWTAAGGIEDLGSSVSDRSTRANATNSDGTIIAGWQDASSGFRQGAIWTNGVQSLITHSNGDRATEAGAISADGVWASGGQGFSNDYQAWKWSVANGIIDIGPAPTSGWRGAATGLTADGSKTVGFYRPWPAPATFGRGFIHTDLGGMIDLTDLATTLGNDLQGAILALPLGISDDGSTVIGVTNSGQGFVLRIPSEPINNSCSGAIALDCDDIITGSTANATNSGGEAAPDVYYSYTGGATEYITISLCSGGTNYDSYLRVYSDCTLATEIIANDDFCGQQSELIFESDGSSTYFIMVEGAGTASGEYSLEISCTPLIGLNDNVFSSLVVYPNPIENQIFISNTEPINSVTIFNTTGQKILHIQPNGTFVKINTDRLQSGVYFANIEASGDKKVIKLIK